VIVGVDGSETAQEAAVVAARLAKALGLPLRVISAYEKADTGVVNVGSEEFRYSSEEDAANVAAGVAIVVGDGIEVESVAVHGKPASVLVDEASRLDAALVVVGNRRMQGVGRVLGSVANSVSHNAPCDVYIAKTT